MEYNFEVEKASKEGLLLILGDMNIDPDKMEEEKYYQVKQAKEYQYRGCGGWRARAMSPSEESFAVHLGP